LVRQLVELIRSWWVADRIRAGPRDGRLLRLCPGHALVVQGRPAVVLRRRVVSTAAGPHVAYECDSAVGPCELIVRLVPGTSAVTLTWSEGASEVSVSEPEVEAYRRRSHRPQ